MNWKFLSFFNSKRFLQLLCILLPTIIILSIIIYQFKGFQSEVNNFLGKVVLQLELPDSETQEKLNAHQKSIMELVLPMFILLLGIIMLTINTLMYYINYIAESNTASRISRILNGVAFVVCAIVMFVLFASIFGGYKDLVYIIKDVNIDFFEIKKKIESVFKEVSYRADLCTLVIYIVFIIFDACQVIVNKGRKNILEKKTAVQQLCFIDVTVVLGILCIRGICSLVDTTLMNSDIPVTIFRAGATGMQVIFSQLIFWFLMCKYYYLKSKQDKLIKDRQSV
ncbi:MAG: hypothetical protein FWE63_04275 [Bacteroidales bacterium]|nr:hypothetical protein [Bacteroidales bacterium]